MKNKDIPSRVMLEGLGIFHKTYRYLISAKVLDQLEEFEILPCCENLCRFLYNCTETPEQIKLLWRTVINNMGSNPESINVSYVRQIWNEFFQKR
ncbi:hypothetical protein U3516DRAFT_775570 [Neocallimastix sp. 'constans']